MTLLALSVMALSIILEALEIAAFVLVREAQTGDVAAAAMPTCTLRLKALSCAGLCSWSSRMLPKTTTHSSIGMRLSMKSLP